MADSNEKLPSDRSFGLFFSLGFAIMSRYYVAKGSAITGVLLGTLAMAGLVVSIVLPQLLHTLNKYWFKLGLLMGKVVNPVVMAFVFFVLVTPVAIFMRMMGRDELRLRSGANQTYWRMRASPEIRPDSFRNQF